MSIIIKGMEMPSNCDRCLFDNGVSCMAYPPSEDMVYDIADGKPAWCPLVPVPPHGRLIDGDVAEVITVNFDEAKGDFCDGILYAGDFISKQPTIIPAEEGET